MRLINRQFEAAQAIQLSNVTMKYENNFITDRIMKKIARNKTAIIKAKAKEKLIAKNNFLLIVQELLRKNIVKKVIEAYLCFES